VNHRVALQKTGELFDQSPHDVADFPFTIG